MSLLEHLGELRRRLLWVIASVGVAGIAGWFAFDPVVEALLRPACPYLADPESCELVFISPLEVFTLRLRIAVYVGFVIAFPIVLFHVWRFIAPGLRSSERRYATPFIVAGTVLFCGGIAFALYTMPQALQFLIGEVIRGEQLSPMLTAREYMSFAIRYLLAFGIAFQLPVVLMILALARIISSRQMAKYRRHVLVGFTGAAALLTPPDVYTLVLGSVVLYGLFEACIWLARLLRR